MILLLAAFGMAPTTTSALFANCISHFSKLGNYTVHIDVKGNAPGKVQNTQYDLAVKGSDTLLRVREPATANLDRSDRSFQLRGSKLLAYDAIAGERLQKTLVGGSPKSVLLGSLLGELDDSLKIALEPAALSSFFSRFVGFRDWHILHKNGLISVARYSGGATTIFWFSEGTYLLKEVALHVKGSTLDWKYTFHRSASTDLMIPSDARKVSSFYVREAPPKYKSPQAKAVVEKLLHAYSGLRYGKIDIQSDDGAIRLYLDGGRLREDRQHFVWAFDGKALTMRNLTTGRFYSGKAHRQILSEYITQVGGEVDPLIRRIIAHRGPYQELFPSHSTVELVGLFGTGSHLCDVINVTSVGLKVSVFVRRIDHLIESMESVTVDQHGKTQSLGNRRFTYTGIGSEPSSVKFHLDPGTSKILPLPKVNGA